MSYYLILIFGIIPLSIFVYISLCFLASVYLKRTDLIDIAWGFGFIMISLLSLISGLNINIVSLTTTALVLIWGLRLSIHIHARFLKTKEDLRYVEIKSKWHKNRNLNTYVKIFLPQAILMYLISLEVVIINIFSSDKSNLAFYFGLFVWLTGFIFESVSDYQLKNFLKSNKGERKVMDKGLWKYSRHPNYFGEVLTWWVFFIISLGTPYWLLAIVSPFVITYLIVKVSGVPLLEQRYKGDKEYEEYKRKTSIFIPFPPKK